jgi:hypothetical protein
MRLTNAMPSARMYKNKKAAQIGVARSYLFELGEIGNYWTMVLSLTESDTPSSYRQIAENRLK